MKLTVKDKDFLAQLRALLDSKDLTIGLKNDGLKRFVLRRNYGDAVEAAFGMTRQGVRWRFQRIFGEIYISAYEALFFIESNFGTELRSMALEIAKERVAMRNQAQKLGKIDDYRLKRRSKTPSRDSSQK